MGNQIMDKPSTYVYLSHFMDHLTPLYGGGKGISVLPDRSILNGDTANTKQLSFQNHSGTHIDFPNHFFLDGLTSESYTADKWIFRSPFLLCRDAIENEIICLKEGELNQIPPQTDFLIIKTGFGKFRAEEKYWKFNPGFSPKLAGILSTRFPLLRVIGMDFISITSFQNREIGREAHRKFLGGANPILLIEDMDLSLLSTIPSSVMCLPLLIKGLDGSPVTIIASI
jgi:arylformamidase